MPATPVIRRRRAARSLLVAGFAPIVAMGAWMAPAVAAEGDESRSGARFLDGEVFGTDLDQIAKLAGVDVENLGDPTTVVEANPLDVTVLDTLNITIPGGLQLPLSNIIKLGAANQWAAAADGGVSHAATGAVADNGGVGTGVEAGFPSNATFDLTDLLGEGVTDLIADVELELGAVSSEAHLVPNEAGDDFEVMRDYEIAGGKLVITIPLLNNPLLNLNLGEGISLSNGQLVIDLDVIFDGLNNLDPNTEIIGAGLFDLLTQGLTDQLSVPVVGPLLSSLLGSAGVGGLVDSIAEAVSSILSVKVNVQPDQPDAASGASAAAATSDFYSVAAVQVTVLPDVQGGAQVTLAESHVGPNKIADESETEVDGTETEVDGTEVDGTETEVDGTEVDGTETEVDGTEVDGTETEADAGGAENGNDGGKLPDTGSGSSQLLVLGLALMLAGGIAAYAVSRRRGLTQG